MKAGMSNLDQNPPEAEKAAPMLMDVRRQKIDRAVPYVGWLTRLMPVMSKWHLVEGQQNIHVATKITRHEKSSLPAGLYQAQLNLKNNNLNVPSFSYMADKGSLSGHAKVELPHEKRLLKWSALLTAKDFNPQTVATAAPVNLLNGQINAGGYAERDKQIIQLNAINLTGKMAGQNETIHLTGKSTAAVLFHNSAQGGGFKSFAVNYDGALNASAVPARSGCAETRYFRNT